MRTKIHAPASWQPELERFRTFHAAIGRPIGAIKLRDYHLRRFAHTVQVSPYEVTLEQMLEHLDNPRWSQNTRRGVRTSIAAFYRWAYVTEATDRDLAVKLPGIPFRPGNPRPTPDEALEKGLRGADERVSTMIRIAAYAGLRCGELALVSTDDLVRTFTGWSLHVHGKGGRKRVVPISGALACEIQRHGPGFIFPGQIDGHLSAAYVSKLISRALPEGETAHKLRHRFATRALRASGNLRVVQELLGHASVATTQIYTGVDDDELRRAAAAAA